MILIRKVFTLQLNTKHLCTETTINSVRKLRPQNWLCTLYLETECQHKLAKLQAFFSPRNIVYFPKLI